MILDKCETAKMLYPQDPLVGKGLVSSSRQRLNDKRIVIGMKKYLVKFHGKYFGNRCQGNKGGIAVCSGFCIFLPSISVKSIFSGMHSALTKNYK